MGEINVSGQIFKGLKPDVKVFFKDGSEVEISEIIMSCDGQILSVIDINGSEHPRSEIEIVTNFLKVPGVGFLKPGSVVRIRGQEYVLNFGEHTNISNQNLISWFLTPIILDSDPDPLGRNTSEDRTLYLSMINEIDLVTV